MIKQITFSRYKAFERYSLHLRKSMNVLVGPNNAGKSTAVAIVRLIALMLRTASRQNPSIAISDAGRSVTGYPIALSRIQDLPGYSDANVHYEFRDEEARVEAKFGSGASIVLVWPSSETADPYFYFDYKPGMNAKRRQQVIDHAPLIGIIPGLSPVEDQEEVLTEKYVNEAMGSRLTSRHFRNHLYFLRQRDSKEYDAVIEFICSNTPEIFDIDLRTRVTVSGMSLDLFFKETSSHSEREIVWAGDGIQIWLQVLFHAFRQRHVDTLILDEPDVFLHPDLQRRLVNVLEDLGPQIILATHAPEVIAEAPHESIVLVDRSRTSSRRLRDTPQLDRLFADLGSGFDLAIARALRCRIVIFVEGTDMKILRQLANKIGAHQLGRERGGVAVVPLGGYSNWPHVEPFALVKNTIFQDAVKIFTFLDRDYRDEAQVLEVSSRLREMGIIPHIWQRKEIESYLLEIGPISRVSGLVNTHCEELLREAIENEAQAVDGNMFSEMMKTQRGKDPSIIHRECRVRFQELWQPETRLAVVPPKRVISSLNLQISEAGGNTLSAHKLALEITADEISSEMRNALLDVENEIRVAQR